MSYDGFYAGLSTRGSANEILNQIVIVKEQVADLAEEATLAASESLDSSGVSGQYAEAALVSAQQAQGFSEDSLAYSLLAAQSASEAGRFITASATPPTVRSDGSPLQVADEWQSTTDGLRYSWSGQAWVALNSSAQELEARLASPSGSELVGWKQGVVEDAVDLLASHTKVGYYGGQLAQFKNDLENPLVQATFVKMCGDSITWGMTTSGSSPTGPRTGQLTDPRNNMTAPSWFNNLHKWLGNHYFRASSPTSTGVAEVTYSRQIDLWPATPMFSLSAFAASEGVLSNTSATLRFYIDYVTDGKGITFDMYGASFYFVYAQLSNGADYELYVDGVSQGVFSTSGTAQFGTVRGHNFTSGQHKIQIVKRGDASSVLRTEAIRVIKTLVMKNDGIIGRTTANWLPGNGLLDASVTTRDRYVFFMLGANDRGQINQPTSPTRITENLVSISNWLASQRPEARVILMCSNEANQDTGVVYKYNMLDVRASVMLAAKTRSLDFIDLFEITRQALTTGVTYLAPSDDLHPGDTGHYLMTRVIQEGIRNADAGTFGVGVDSVTRQALDLNNLTLLGEYYVGSATANNPSGETALVVVSPQGDGRIIQRLYPYSGARSWRRTRLQSGSWISREDALRSEVLALSGGAMSGVFKPANYTLAALPSVTGNASGLIWISDLSGGAFLCYSDGTAWRRVDTKEIAS